MTTIKEAQAKLVAAINSDPEAVISAAEKFGRDISDIVAAARKVPGDIKGVAAVAVRYAMTGKDTAETTANLIRFSAVL